MRVSEGRIYWEKQKSQYMSVPPGHHLHSIGVVRRCYCRKKVGDGSKGKPLVLVYCIVRFTLVSTVPLFFGPHPWKSIKEIMHLPRTFLQQTQLVLDVGPKCSPWSVAQAGILPASCHLCHLRFYWMLDQHLKRLILQTRARQTKQQLLVLRSVKHS